MSKRLAFICILAGSSWGCMPDPAGNDDLRLVDTEAYRAREVLIGVQPGSMNTRSGAIERDFGLRMLEHSSAIGVGRFEITGPETAKEMTDWLNQEDRFDFVEPNYLAFASGGSDPYVPWQWNIDRIGVPDTPDYGTGSGLVVAVLDTGVRAGGPDGFDRLLPGYDFYYGDEDPTDIDGHGTFVAGTIAQSTDNGIGVSGLAPGVAILPVKVLGDQGYGDIQAIANGIAWAAEQGADVINMSLGSAYPSQTLERACLYADDLGVVLVAASGNEFARQLNYPAAYETVISVGATRADDSRAGYSNTGQGLDLMAPGGDLSRDQNGDGYADGILQETFTNGRWTYTFWEGTSMAAPHVAAAAALVLEQGEYSPEEVYEILASTTRDLGDYGYDTETGHGLINIQAAVALAARGGDSEPSPSVDSETEEEETTPSPDDTPPTISGVTGWSEGSSFTIQWVTDEPADTYIEFEGYGSYGEPTLSTQHTLRFNAQQGSSFRFTLSSTDADGNTSEDGPWQISL